MRTILRLSILNTTLLLAACATPMPLAPDHTTVSQVSVDKSLVVDCLLPGTVRRLGRLSVISMPRQSINATAGDCEIRGGEYVAFDRADYATALRVLLPEAQKGRPEAQTYVGEIYEKGLGVAHDYTLAAQWYRKAAEQGYSRAQVNLGLLYERGLGVPKEPVTALNWYRKASRLTDDELAFASTLKAERQALKEEVELRQREAASLRKQLDATQRQLEMRSKGMEAIQQELKQSRLQLRELHKRTPAPDSAAVQTLERRAKELEALLEQGRQERTSFSDEVERQNDTLTAHQRDAQSREESLRREIRALEQQSATSRGQLEISQRELEEQRRRLGQVQEKLRAAEEISVSERQRFEQEETELDAKLKESAAKVTRLETEVTQLKERKTSLKEPLDGFGRVVAIASR